MWFPVRGCVLSRGGGFLQHYVGEEGLKVLPTMRDVRSKPWTRSANPAPPAGNFGALHRGWDNMLT
jgi:hypothetical protein